MQSADRVYTSGVKRFVLAPLFHSRRAEKLSPDPWANQPPEERSFSPHFIAPWPEPSPFPFQDVCPTLGRWCSYAGAWIYSLGSVASATSGLCLPPAKGSPQLHVFDWAATPDGGRWGQERARRAVPCKSPWRLSRSACGPAAPNAYLSAFG